MVEPPLQRDVALEVVRVQRGVSRECVAVMSSKRLEKWYASGSETWKNAGTPSPTNCSVSGAVSTNHSSNSRGVRDGLLGRDRLGRDVQPVEFD